MSDTILYEELLILEDEVIDQYVRGQMSAADRTSFEGYFLRSAEHQEKLRFARALSKYVDRAQSGKFARTIAESTRPLAAGVESSSVADQRSPESGSQPEKKPRIRSFWPFENPALSFALAAAIIVAVVGISWTIVRSLRSPSVPANVFATTLTPGGPTREGGETQSFSLPPGTDVVRLQLTVPWPQFRDYWVSLQNGAGVSLWQADGLRPVGDPGKGMLNVEVPASLLKPDYYRIKLQGRTTDAYEEVSSYNFRVR